MQGAVMQKAEHHAQAPKEFDSSTSDVIVTSSYLRGISVTCSEAIHIHDLAFRWRWPRNRVDSAYLSLPHLFADYLGSIDQSFKRDSVCSDFAGGQTA